MNGQYLDYENCLNVEWAEKVDLLWRLMTCGHLAEQQCLRPRQLYTAKCKRIEFDVEVFAEHDKASKGSDCGHQCRKGSILGPLCWDCAGHVLKNFEQLVSIVGTGLV